MQQTGNSIERMLRDMERLLADLKSAQQTQSNFMRVGEIINHYFSRKTFYTHVENGLINLYKFGGASFVKRDEFYAAFKKTNPNPNPEGGADSEQIKKGE